MFLILCVKCGIWLWTFYTILVASSVDLCLQNVLSQGIICCGNVNIKNSWSARINVTGNRLGDERECTNVLWFWWFHYENDILHECHGCVSGTWWLFVLHYGKSSPNALRCNNYTIAFALVGRKDDDWLRYHDSISIPAHFKIKRYDHAPCFEIPTVHAWCS